MRGSFWRGKRVLLTGHTGFKGAWLALWLQRLGAEVTGFALDPPTEPSLHDLARVAEGMHDLRGDVREARALERAFSAASPEIVIHMAAQSLVLRSYAEPVETFATNVMGTVNVLETVRHTPGVRVALVVTSDKCYANPDGARAHAEGDPLGGVDPYSSSKAGAELVTAAYRSSFFQRGVAIASARSGNVIGGGDWARDRLVPDAVRAFAAGEPLEIRNPRAVRPWQHVLDPLAGYLHLAERLWEDRGMAEAWNFGPADDDALPVAEVIERFARLWGAGAAWRLAQGTQPHESRELRLDCSKARGRLEWAPRLALQPALEWTAEWYHAWAAGSDLRALTLQQLDRYAELAQAVRA